MKSRYSGKRAWSDRMGKLSGIKVVDLSLFLPGPMLSLMMADQGAEVVKVEPPAGDPARAQAPFEMGQSIWFRNLNRGKRSLVLDLKSDGGRAALWELVDQADVFIEGFRPGVGSGPEPAHCLLLDLGFRPGRCARRSSRA